MLYSTLPQMLFTARLVLCFIWLIKLNEGWGHKCNVTHHHKHNSVTSHQLSQSVKWSSGLHCLYTALIVSNQRWCVPLHQSVSSTVLNSHLIPSVGLNVSGLLAVDYKHTQCTCNYTHMHCAPRQKCENSWVSWASSRGHSGGFLCLGFEAHDLKGCLTV